MTFTTLTFAVFYIIVFALYWGLRNRRAQNVLLVVASYFFYGWWDWRFTFLMAGSSLVDFAVSLVLLRTEHPRKRLLVLWSALSFNLVVLGYFKYFNFFADSFVRLAHQFGWEPSLVTVSVILPVGLSFYTFQTMGYTIDVYRRHLVPTRSIVNYFAFVSYFPQLVAGPIERATHLLPQIERDRTFSLPDARDGCRQALWGFFKKLAIADNLGLVVDRVYHTPSASPAGALAVATLFFAFQIYCDFSAYSDIAIGTGKTMGISLMRNFAYPYFSQDVAEFWRRWHISLSTWFRDYVFIPLGGSRTGAARTASNLLVTFVLSGLWHGAAWTFVVWGLLNGLLVLASVALRRGGPKRSPTEVPGEQRLIPDVATVARILITFACICATWVFFRAPTMGDALDIFRRSVTESGFARAAWELIAQNGWLAAVLVAFILIEWTQRRYPHPLVLPRTPLAFRWIIYTALIWFTVIVMPSKPASFIYFQF
jgi:D-alanyl-lipoteichoic acid acyltransferase DltB (MBOAT superfamily)